MVSKMRSIEGCVNGVVLEKPGLASGERAIIPMGPSLALGSAASSPSSQRMKSAPLSF